MRGEGERDLADLADLAEVTGYPVIRPPKGSNAVGSASKVSRSSAGMISFTGELVRFVAEAQRGSTGPAPTPGVQ